MGDRGMHPLSLYVIINALGKTIRVLPNAFIEILLITLK